MLRRETLEWPFSPLAVQPNFCHVNTLGSKNAWAVRVTVMLDGRRWRPCRQRRRKKKHLIEAAPFGGLDQMLRTTVQGRGLFPSQTKNQEVLGAAPPSQNRKKFRKIQHEN